MMSREADLYERAHSAEQDLAHSRAFAFAASWERMVLLASTLEYRDEYGCVLPSPDRDHDLITLEAMMAVSRPVSESNAFRAIDRLEQYAGRPDELAEPKRSIGMTFSRRVPPSQGEEKP